MNSYQLLPLPDVSVMSCFPSNSPENNGSLRIAFTAPSSISTTTACIEMNWKFMHVKHYSSLEMLNCILSVSYWNFTFFIISTLNWLRKSFNANLVSTFLKNELNGSSKMPLLYFACSSKAKLQNLLPI